MARTRLNVACQHTALPAPTQATWCCVLCLAATTGFTQLALHSHAATTLNGRICIAPAPPAQAGMAAARGHAWPCLPCPGKVLQHGTLPTPPQAATPLKLTTRMPLA